MNHPAPPFAACTIVASNYLARALVLHDSLKRQHPEVDFWLLLIDDTPLSPLTRGAVDRRGLHILRVGEIGLPPDEIGNFRFAYDVTEVSTAYKPWTLETVVRRSGLHAFYIDPDIEFFSPMTSLVEAVNGHELVLTPHVLHAMKRDGAQPSEADIMGSGIYNLGFLGLNRDALKVTEWWGERLKRECYSAPAEQRFTDQRWMDFAPTLFDCHISKEETYNVAYWNADARPVVRENGTYLVRGKPLSFFHYSGLSEKTPHLLTRHHADRPRVVLSEQPALTAMTGAYIKAVASAKSECKDAATDYPFDSFPGGGKIALEMRRAFLAALVRSEQNGENPLPSPFGPGGEEAFANWMSEPVPSPGGQASVPRALLLLREVREDLKTTFADPTGADAVRLMDWFRRAGQQEFHFPLRLIQFPEEADARPVAHRIVPGLEIIGYLRTESGVGQAARLLATGLKSSTIPFQTHVDSTAPSRQEDPFQDDRTHLLAPDERFGCCVLCVNADSVEALKSRLGGDYFHNRQIAGLWFWEVEAFPPHLHSAFYELDEVWVASEFIRNILVPISPVPVHYLPLPFGVGPKATPLNRASLGIPEGFLFLFSFDFHSVFRRKNPLGIVEAFKQAFAPGEGPTLVIKGINAEAHRADLMELIHASRDRSDIIILSNYLDASTNLALTAACDCYVSLHRSEGLGLTMAEAMRHEKPVIATGYSGNVDFMNEENSYLCRFTMTPVGVGAEPYSPFALWAEPDISHAATLMRHVYSNPDEAAAKGRAAAEFLAANFNPERCAAAVEKLWKSMSNTKPSASRNDGDIPAYSTSFSAPLRMLRKCAERPLDVKNTVPSFGTLLFQGPQKMLRKMLSRIEQHRRPFDEAAVATASSHDVRLAALESELRELREQYAEILASQRTSGDAESS